MPLSDPHLSLSIALEPATGADAIACLDRYRLELDARFETGFDMAAGSRIDPDEMVPPNGWFLIARSGGRPVGCGALRRLSPDSGEIKRVWISSDARGLGIATAIMDRLETIAAEAGMPRLLLDTNASLVEARAMYLKRGYREIAPYNDNPYAHHWFEKTL